jgi:hypothetical protein
MKNTLNQFLFAVSKINKNHLNYAISLLALVLLVLGAGAPEDVGGIGR